MLRRYLQKAIFKNVFYKHENELNKPEDFINHSLYFEAKTFLHVTFCCGR